MDVLIDNTKEVSVDNKIQLSEDVTLEDGQEATVYVTIRLDHVDIDVHYYDAHRQPVRTERWFERFEAIAERLKRNGSNV